MSDVYYTDLKTDKGVNLLDKLDNLVKKAGIKDIDFKDKYVAIKIHFGEPGNMAYLRPNYSRVIVNLVKELGGKPYLTDSNTLYVGRRNNGLNHLEAAYENGYNPFTCGCHIIIADGVKGTDEETIEINGEYVKEAKIGKAISDADVIISMNHFKGHMSAGFGGCLKNIGMGCGSIAGKMEMHSQGKPTVKESVCISCGKCIKACNYEAIEFVNKKARIINDKCVGCGRCVGTCPVRAISPSFDEKGTIMNKKIAEYTLATLKDKKHFHINFVIDISPDCDCFNRNNEPIAPNIGILASFDPVALDMASVDLVNEAVGEIEHKEKCDVFKDIHPNTDWEVGLDHGVKIGLGKKEYKLIKLD